MINIQKIEDLKSLDNEFIYNYINDLLEYLLKTYEVDNIESFGAIFYIESKADLLKYTDFFLSAPLCEQRFEWIEDIGNGYVNGCIVIDNDRAINLVGKKEFFAE